MFSPIKNMTVKSFRPVRIALLAALLGCFALLPPALSPLALSPLRAQDTTTHTPGAPKTELEARGAHGGAAPADDEAAAGGAHGAGASKGGAHGGAHGKEAAPRGIFDAHQGTWLNWLARPIFGQGPVEKSEHAGETHYTNINYDFVVVAIFAMLLLAALWIKAARGLKLRPEGKPHSLSNLFEAALDGFQNYLVGVMGEPLARKYSALVASFFFTILTFNYLGLVPGMLAPTANPNIPIGLAIVAFFSVHIIAIREAGIKSWFAHFVGEPKWLAPLNFPLHILGELIKPLSLSLRLLCNVFGEEMVISQFAGMAIAIAAAMHLPAIIPLQLPFMMLGVFFGALQALVFSTLLAIYISILSTHHDEHDEHNIQGHVEHPRGHGLDKGVVAHPTEATLA